jgi:hypothetical protein
MARESTTQGWARGGVVLAGTFMLIIGVYQIFLGVAAIVNNAFFLAAPNYAYHLNLTGWGWIHIGIGIVVALAGFYLFTASTVAKIIGIGLLSISAIANFFFLPYYPLWSLLVIGLDIFAIWAIAAVRPDYAEVTADERAMAYGGYGPGGTQAEMQAGGAQTGERWPAENAPGGRHWAPENVKEGAQGRPGETAEQAQQRAAAAGRTMPRGGNPPPPSP